METVISRFLVRAEGIIIRAKKLWFEFRLSKKRLVWYYRSSFFFSSFSKKKKKRKILLDEEEARIEFDLNFFFFFDLKKDSLMRFDLSFVSSPFLLFFFFPFSKKLLLHEEESNLI